MTTKRFVALVIVLVLAVGSFLAFATLPWDSSSSGNTARLTASVRVYGAGQPIDVDKGDKFVIALVANPTTGYSWTAEDNRKVKQLKSHFVPGDSSLMGAGGTQLLTFQATNRGTTTLTLDYARSFEKNTPPAQTEQFAVTIG